MVGFEKRKMERFSLELPTCLIVNNSNRKQETLELQTSNVCAGGAFVKKSLGNDDFLNTILDKIPFPIFLMDDDVRIHVYNLAAISLFNIELYRVSKVGCGDAFYCVYSMPDGCGESEACKECVIRNSVRKSFGGSKVVREKTDIQLVRGNKVEQIQMLVTTEPLKYNDELYVIVILEVGKDEREI